jgi:hypothetical protein
MRPVDQDSLSEFIAEFLNGCGIEPPFYLVALSADGSVIVSHWSAIGEMREVCEHVGADVLALPIILTVVSLEGRGASARIVEGEHGPRLM